MESDSCILIQNPIHSKFVHQQPRYILFLYDLQKLGRFFSFIHLHDGNCDSDTL